MRIDMHDRSGYGNGSEIDLEIEFRNGRRATVHLLDFVRESGVFTGPIDLPPVIMIADEDKIGRARAQFDTRPTPAGDRPALRAFLDDTRGSIAIALIPFVAAIVFAFLVVLTFVF